jgi:glycosyltransferase involved in cell wall biosynthesis
MAKISTRRRNKVLRPQRIAVHDYCGHPFQFDLSRELARRGHEVRHLFFTDDAGPKGVAKRLPSDPISFSVEPISIGGSYSKTDLIRRRQADVLYGKLTGQRLEQFAPTITISGNTPLEAQASIMRSAHRAGSAFVFWMQDFYSLAAAKILQRKVPVLGHVVGAYYRHLEARMLRQSDRVVVISEDFRSALTSLGVNEQKIDAIPNWGALAEVPMRSKDNPWASTHGITGKFVFLYSGTLALKHNPESLWDLAKHFEGDPEVRVVVVGSGVSFEALKARRERDALANLVLLPLQPMEIFADVLASADVFVALLENDAGPFSVPSKVLNYLCAGRPILLSAPSDNLSVRVLAGAAAGEAVPSGDKEAFIAAASRLRSEPGTRARLGEAARRYAESSFDISAIADRFEDVFASALSRAEAGRPGSTPLRPARSAQV